MDILFYIGLDLYKSFNKKNNRLPEWEAEKIINELPDDLEDRPNSRVFLSMRDFVTSVINMFESGRLNYCIYWIKDTAEVIKEKMKLD